jgi:D-serine deaminase-like pyridoxal phosphate-dependent protein
MNTSEILCRIESPALFLDEKKCRANIDRMVSKARSARIAFRPHFKTHQSAEIGQWFREAGTNAITVSSVAMGHYFADAGWKDITIAFPANPRELASIKNLAARCSLNLVVNNPAMIPLLNEAAESDEARAFSLQIWIELDTGYHRSGIDPENLSLIREIIHLCINSNHLFFTGFLSHFGETYMATSGEEIKTIATSNLKRMDQVRTRVGNSDAIQLSIGDTPSFMMLKEFSPANEVRPGNAVFFDLMQEAIGSCSIDDIAVCLAAPVSEIHPERQEVVVHAGAIHLSKESVRENNQTIYGKPVFFDNQGWTEPIPGAFLRSVSQEHGVVHIPTPFMKKIKPGSLIGILPVHSCLAAQAMQQYLTLEGRTISGFFNKQV